MSWFLQPSEIAISRGYTDGIQMLKQCLRIFATRIKKIARFGQCDLPLLLKCSADLFYHFIIVAFAENNIR